MKIGIGLGRGPDAAKAARDAVRQAKKGVRKPSLALVFGGVTLDQKKLHAALCRELDPKILFGGTSYAEITTAGVTKGSVAVLLLELDGAAVSFSDTALKAKPFDTGVALADALPKPSGMPLGLLFTKAASGYDDQMLLGLRTGLSSTPIFGGICCGDYDRGLGDPGFWTTSQYAGPRLTNTSARMALLDLPRKDHRVAFAFEHGWEPVGPEVVLTKCEGSYVYEVGGMPVFDYYRQFLGDQHSNEFFELMIQRYGFSLSLDDAEWSILKLPVSCDFKKKRIMYVPAEDLQGKRVRMIQSSRKALIEGARRAARRCLAALGGVKPRLLLMVSCCTRSAILHSKMDDEVSAVREVFGYDVPIFGYYSGGEIVPYRSRYAEASDPGDECAGSQYHATTVALMALGAKKPAARIAVPPCDDCPPEKAGELRALLNKSEATLDSSEAFLSNMSRKSYQDGEKLRKQNEVIHRYTPHDVFQKIGDNAARGSYELAEAEFNGAFMFMDVKGFTSYSETHKPKDVVGALNELFEPATEIIYDCGGDVDKFIGDCIFAAFSSPARAVAAGKRILRLFEKTRAGGNPFTVRVGINAGRAVRANVGSKNRREYTYIGDAVNLAQRLESNCEPGKLLLSAGVYEAVKASTPNARKREIAVKGKKDPVVCYDCEANP